MSKGGDVFEKYNIWLYGLITVNVFVLLLIMLFVFYRSQYGNKGSDGSKGATGERGDIGKECKIKDSNPVYNMPFYSHPLNEEYKKHTPLPDKYIEPTSINNYDTYLGKVCMGKNEGGVFNDMTLTQCQQKCDSDSECISFEYGHSNGKKPKRCTISHSCASPETNSNNYNLYTRQMEILIPQQQKSTHTIWGVY